MIYCALLTYTYLPYTYHTQKLSYCTVLRFYLYRFSCVHQGRYDTATIAREYVLSKRRQQQQQQDRHAAATTTFINSLLPGRRILLVGDSTMRQLFIGLGCRLWQHGLIVEDYVRWNKSWPCQGQPNCIRGGQHSGFERGSFFVKNNNDNRSNNASLTEIHYLPNTFVGGEEPGMVKRWLDELNNNNTNATSLHSYYNSTITFGPNLAHDTRGSQSLTRNDVVVITGGLHMRMNNKYRQTWLEQLGQVAKILRHSANAPPLIFVTTISQHFWTVDGMYGSQPMMTMDNDNTGDKNDTSSTNKTTRTDCQASIVNNLRASQEMEILAQYNMSKRHILYVADEELGAMHIGGNDCSHYCMPGPIDVVGDRLLEMIATSVPTY